MNEMRNPSQELAILNSKNYFKSVSQKIWKHGKIKDKIHSVYFISTALNGGIVNNFSSFLVGA